MIKRPYMPGATRIFVISDLHLGGDAPTFMSFPKVLAEFIDGLPQRARADEAIELVVAGDVIDFLAIALDGRTDAWTDDPRRAEAKLQKAMARDHEVFAALGRHVRGGNGLTILLGNHDLELALPGVQQALCAGLECRPGAVRFVADGRAWRFGRAVVEHGNRYDDANLNDWDGLREIASCQSRGETPAGALRPSFGSKLVQTVVNKHKRTFEFIDTLQPQGVLVAYLMAALEPALIADLPDLLAVWRAQRLAQRNAAGTPPKERTTRSSPTPRSHAPIPPSPDLDALFGAPIDTSRLDTHFAWGAPASGPPERTTRGGASAYPIDAARGVAPTTRGGGVPAVVRELLRPTDESLLRSYLDVDRPAPRWRLKIVQDTLREMTWTDDSLEPGGPVGPYGRAAERIRRATGAQVVVMGHTHQARESGPPGRAEYINTGTWADLVRIPFAVLADDEAGLDALEAWLKDLSRDRDVREVCPSWAEIRVEPDGEVTSAALERRRNRATTPR